MNAPKNLNEIIEKKMKEHNDTTDTLDGMFLDDVQRSFFNFSRKNGYDIEPRDAYEKMAVFIAEVIAKYCPRTYGKYDDRPYSGPKSGIIISGEVGRGKTILMRNSYDFLTNFFQTYRKNRGEKPGVGLIWIEETEFSIKLASRGPSYLEEILLEGRGDILFFDDLGNERTSKIYGNQVNGEEIIRVRDESLKRFGVPTVFTTNLRPDDIEARYGIFNYSRIIGGYDGIFVDYPADRRIHPPTRPTESISGTEEQDRECNSNSDSCVRIDARGLKTEIPTSARFPLTDQLIPPISTS